MHSRNLRPDSIDELCAVTATDSQHLGARPNDASVNVERWALPLVPLRVDAPHAARADHDVIDVRSRPRDAAITQQAERVG